jgi:hypothetical protein
MIEGNHNRIRFAERDAPLPAILQSSPVFDLTGDHACKGELCRE